MLTRSGLSKDAALRSNVASSKSHFGEAICQMNQGESDGLFANKQGEVFHAG